MHFVIMIIPGIHVIGSRAVMGKKGKIHRAGVEPTPLAHLRGYLGGRQA